MRTILFAILLMMLLLAGCGSAAPALPVTPGDLPALTPLPTAVLTEDLYFASDGGGDPRGPGYWLLWNTCAPENQAEIARANGGRSAGWILLDDLLADPGIQLGGFPIETCPQALAVLQARNLSGADRADAPDFLLARQLLAAYLNLEAGAESCLGVVDAILGAHELLQELGYDGETPILDAASSTEQLSRTELFQLALEQYNRGELCR